MTIGGRTVLGANLYWGRRKPQVLERLKMANGEFVCAQDLILYVYGNQAPKNPEQAVNAFVRQLRRLGFQITSQRGCGSPGCRLTGTEAGASLSYRGG